MTLLAIEEDAENAQREQRYRDTISEIVDTNPICIAPYLPDTPVPGLDFLLF